MEERKEPTMEEIQEMRNRMHTYYEEQIPYLEMQAKFEGLLANIEESRFKRTHYTHQLAQLMTSPDPEVKKLRKEK